METNCNLTLNPLNLTLPSFFTISVIVYEKKESSRSSPPPQTWGSSLLPVGPLASGTQAPKPVSLTKSGSEWIWSENMVKLTLIKMSL